MFYQQSDRLLLAIIKLGIHFMKMVKFSISVGCMKPNKVVAHCPVASNVVLQTVK